MGNSFTARTAMGNLDLVEQTLQSFFNSSFDRNGSAQDATDGTILE